jgi:ParB family transcriptional regulator, chromosome partitioning protein
LEEIVLSLVDDNPYNVRSAYDKAAIDSLAESLSSTGLLAPIRVRKKKDQDRYEIVFGHRRVRAARLLGWKTIPAEIVEASDGKMIELSLVENLQRAEVSDYEKAQSFRRIHEQFGITYVGIAKLVGYSKQHVANLVRMTELLDADTLARDPQLMKYLLMVSEHHARVLGELQDQERRANLLKFVVKEGLSVRDLERIVHRLRSWFQLQEDSRDGPKGDQSRHATAGDRRLADVTEIERMLRLAESELPQIRNFRLFEEMHAFSNGFSIYDDSPPFLRLKDEEARTKKRDWFYSLAPKYRASIRDIDVQLFSDFALATLYVDYVDKENSGTVLTTTRGSVVFIRMEERWKILHEHWSKLESIPGHTLA